MEGRRKGVKWGQLNSFGKNIKKNNSVLVSAFFLYLTGQRSLTSYAMLSASLATVNPASSPSPISLETASSTRPRMKDFPDDGRKVMASAETENTQQLV